MDSFQLEFEESIIDLINKQNKINEYLIGEISPGFDTWIGTQKQFDSLKVLRDDIIYQITDGPIVKGVVRYDSKRLIKGDSVKNGTSIIIKNSTFKNIDSNSSAIEINN